MILILSVVEGCLRKWINPQNILCLSSKLSLLNLSSSRTTLISYRLRSHISSLERVATLIPHQMLILLMFQLVIDELLRSVRTLVMRPLNLEFRVDLLMVIVRLLIVKDKCIVKLVNVGH